MTDERNAKAILSSAYGIIGPLLQMASPLKSPVPAPKSPKKPVEIGYAWGYILAVFSDELRERNV
jgi:hypothetical protein